MMWHTKYKSKSDTNTFECHGNLCGSGEGVGIDPVWEYRKASPGKYFFSWERQTNFIFKYRLLELINDEEKEAIVMWLNL